MFEELLKIQSGDENCERLFEVSMMTSATRALWNDEMWNFIN
jgi:hypothetical protein